jgi:DNA-binding NarL/FixJ family response regulator
VTEERLDEICRLLAIMIRKDSDTQTATILEMSRAGLKNTRIAELLGTTPNTVNVTVQKARKGPTSA